MTTSARNAAIAVAALAIFAGARYAGSAIHYGCANPAEDCPPPIYMAGQVGWYATGGSLLPLWNRDATAVDKVSWRIEKSDAAVTSPDDPRFTEQKIAADVTFVNGTTQRFELGTAYGCKGTSTSEIVEQKLMLGRVDCYFALTGTTFSAYSQANRFRIERADESAKDGSVMTRVLVEIPATK